ncbi:MAG: ammonia-forming cytochrome c nitrite reductase subunit c552 [Phycisphaerales bacterium JB060]
MSDTQPTQPDARRVRARRFFLFGSVLAASAVAMFVVTIVLVTMFQHKQDARTPFIRVVEVDEATTDPRPWGLNWPHQYDGYMRTAEGVQHGGSSALAASKLEESPWLRRLYAGYAFSLDYREARGHAYMLYDQTATERVTRRQQSGACLHCHASNTVAYRRVGLEAMGLDASDEALAAEFNMPAVIRGFEEVSRRPYHEVLAILAQSPDGTPDNDAPLHPRLDQPNELETPAGHIDLGNAHPVSCIDCHDPQTMAIRVTRPGFMQGIGALAASDEPVPHMPSIDRWRQGSRDEPYDPNALATRQEMRSFVCGQCHVEYYCADKMTLTFPWGNGLRVEQIERFWDETTFPDDGAGFYDYAHGETGAKLYKAQHPEFELWAQGVHAANGVSCADCHMPYERQGAMKASSHHVQSPLLNVNNACQQCHNIPESEIIANVRTIQDRTVALMERAAGAMTDMLDAVMEAKAAGATEEQLAPVYEMQRKAMWRLDYISSENSKGFHASQEAARILGESIDYSRRAQAMALRLRAPEAPSTEGIPTEGVQGVTPAGEAPIEGAVEPG